MSSIRDILSPTAIDKAVDAVKVPNSFVPAVFFRAIGIPPREFNVVKEIFDFLDKTPGGFIEIDEAENVLGQFKIGARKLTPSETAAFMKAGDPDNTGKISLAGFYAMVNSSN
ncbi:parvalbumin beta-like isoform X2 [Ranitomeya variabilis]